MAETSKLSPWFALVERAVEQAKERERDVYLADDRAGVWAMYLDDEEGYAPAILIAVSPSGTIRLIDNTDAGNSEEPWRR